MFKRLRSKLNYILTNKHMNEIASGTLLAFGLKVLGTGLAFIYNIAIARLLGAEDTGVFFLALSVTAIGSVVSRVGLDNALLRFIATHSSKNETDQVKAVYRLGMHIAIATSGIFSIVGFWLSPWIANEIFNNPGLTEPLRWMSLAILPFAILNLQAESLKGLKRIRDSLLIQSVGIPLIAMLLIWPLTQLNGVVGAAWSYLIATITISLLGFWAWSRATANFLLTPPPYPSKILLASCKPLFITSLINQGIFPWAPLLLLGLWVDSQAIGIYGAASRVAMLVSFMLNTINNILAPKFAELFIKGKLPLMEQTARYATLIITLLTTPIFLMLIFGGKWIMLLFGPEFVEGTKALAILAIGQFVNTFTGSVNYLLIVTGHELTIRNITLFATFWLIAIGIVLIPSQGIIGAAIASASSIAILNILSTYYVWKKLGIFTIPIPK